MKDLGNQERPTRPPAEIGTPARGGEAGHGAIVPGGNRPPRRRIRRRRQSPSTIASVELVAQM